MLVSPALVHPFETLRDTNRFLLLRTQLDQNDEPLTCSLAVYLVSRERKYPVSRPIARREVDSGLEGLFPLV